MGNSEKPSKIMNVNIEPKNELHSDKSEQSIENKITESKAPVTKVLEIGSKLLDSYRYSVEKAVQSSSNSLISGVSSFTNRVTKVPVISQFVPWLAEENS